MQRRNRREGNPSLRLLGPEGPFENWWLQEFSTLRPHAFQARALPSELHNLVSFSLLRSVNHYCGARGGPQEGWFGHKRQ